MISSCCKWLVPVASCSRREASTVANLLCSGVGLEDEVVDLIGPGLVDPVGAVSLQWPVVVPGELFAVVLALKADPDVVPLPELVVDTGVGVDEANADPDVAPLMLLVVVRSGCLVRLRPRTS